MTNYRPVSTLSNLSKVFEKLIYSQINTYMSDKFSKYLTGFCKNMLCILQIHNMGC